MRASHGFLVLGASHHNTPLEVRERFAVAPDQLAPLHAHLRAVPGVEEVLVLNTCNRFEVYAVLSDHGRDAALEAELCATRGLAPNAFAGYRFALRDAEAVAHLLGVASGIDSQIVGETEIFGQVKNAYARATEFGTVGPVLNRIMQKCFQSAKLVRSSTPIGAGQVSIATVSVDLTEKIFGDLEDCSVLVLGTGEVGEKTVKAMSSRGVRTITVLSRAMERAEALARSVQGRAGTFETLARDVETHDIVIGCTTAQAPVVTGTMVRSLMRQRRLRPLFFIDLGIPRNFDASLAQVDSVFLYDLDDLARIADENLAARRAAVDRCRRLVDERAAKLWEQIEPRLAPVRMAAGANEINPRRQTV
ncbi:glutamyl-tRNA reductase [Opitutales bacterium ASA1]|uniref:glutamyl-tRNA reductase n=1 Tax=Congregicoccus parvus TaxID=3081749 RepID=UPI002B2E93CF|nr:glutamyl-tRNA reductase [Opitutales bacterium ASA1]